jgi:hypothetical protein
MMEHRGEQESTTVEIPCFNLRNLRNLRMAVI